MRLAEGPREVRQTLKPHRIRHLGYVTRSFREKLRRALEADAPDEVGWGFAHQLTRATEQVRSIEKDMLRQLRHAELRVGQTPRTPRAADPRTLDPPILTWAAAETRESPRPRRRTAHEGVAES